MPTFKVEYQVTPPAQTKDVDADTREHAVDQVVQDETPNGEVAISRVAEVVAEVEPAAS